MPSHTARDLDKDLKKAGVPKRTHEGKIDFHGARRAFCTLLLEAGANPAEVQALMRHSDARTTMQIYARARTPRLGELAEKVGEVLLGSDDGEADAVSVPVASCAEAESRKRLERKELNGGGGGNRTPVPRRIHTGFYRNSPSFGSRPPVSEGQDTFGPAPLVFRAFGSGRAAGAIPIVDLRSATPGEGRRWRGRYLSSQSVVGVAN